MRKKHDVKASSSARSLDVADQHSVNLLNFISKEDLERINQDTDLNRCVFVDWYRFKECTITSCKNFSEVRPSKCLAVGRVIPEGNKVISDEEIHYFKFSHQKITTRTVSMRRKNATDKVRIVLVLREFIRYIEQEYYVVGRQPHFSHLYLQKMERRWPLKSRHLEFKNWMWEYILDEAVFEAFCSKRGLKESNLALSIGAMLGLDDQRYALFRKKIKSIL